MRKIHSRRISRLSQFDKIAASFSGIDTWPTQYPWVNAEGLRYFKQRLTQARRDVEHGLHFTLAHFSQTRALQERALEILQFKLDVLWALADAIMLSQCNITIHGPKQAQPA